jgi:Dolichyl-phosphate-mannose-protein mannosyltransferase
MTTPTAHRTRRDAGTYVPITDRTAVIDGDRRGRRVGLRRAAREQLAVAGGQLAAGTGNLAFALIAARLLAPGAFAELAAFLALYLLIHVPAGSLSAGSALAPDLAARARRRALAAGGAVGAAIAVLALPLSAALDLPAAMLLAAAASAPTAGLLALYRGRLYGLNRTARVVGSLLAEPAVRLSLGVALAALIGPVGGAAGVVVAGWAALAVTRVPRRTAAPAREASRSVGAPPGAAVAAFLLLAVVQNQDVLLANALLDASEAGRFAVLSTLGGAAAFATTTVPLMLLSRAGTAGRKGPRAGTAGRDGPAAGAAGREALGAALAVAAVLGLAAVAVVALSPARLVAGLFGARYEAVGAIAVPYVLAMALLGVARVFVAHACAEGRHRGALVLLVAVVALHVGLIVALGDDAAGVATATLAATATLTAGAAALTLPDPLALLRRRDVALVAGLAVAGLAVRLLATRGIWLDEATSIHQAGMPLGVMLDSLRTTDVHPPLHHVVLWGTVRLLGTDELAVRLPSLLAATALVPLLYAAGRDIYDRHAGIAAAALGTVAPFAVWYAQEARMYALFMLFALIAVWMQVRIMRGGGARCWLVYVLAAAALVYTQYFGILLVAVQQIGFAVALRHRRGLALRWLGWTGLLALLVLPLVPFALDQFAANEAAGRGFQKVPSQTGGAVAAQGAAPDAYAAITNVVWAVLGYHSDATMTAIAALWPLALLLALALLGRGRSGATLVVVACATVPALALFALGQLKPFVFEVRYFVGIVPLALLLIARALTSWARRPAAGIAGVAIATALLALGLADQQLNGSNPRIYDFKGAVDRIEAHARPGDVIVFSPDYLNHVLAYYEDDGLRMRSVDDGLPKPRRGRRVFVLASFLDKPQFRQAADRTVRRLERDHELVRRDSRPQIRIWEFR